MLTELLNPNFVADFNLASNAVSASIAPQSLSVAKKAYDLQVELYNEFEQTHKLEEARYVESKLIQQTQIKVLEEILAELKLLNSKINK